MRNIEYYDFAIDKSIETRWDPIFMDFQTQIDTLKIKLESIISPYASIIGYLDTAYQSYPKDKIMHHSEICYIAKKIGMTPFKILLLQLIYETSSACTSAILQTSDQDFFIRTMDWPMDFLKDITIGLNIIKNGVIIGKAVTWLGYLGYLTASNIIDNYTIAINYRRTKMVNITSLMKNLFRTVKLKWPIGYLVRYIIESQYSSSDARDILIMTELISPCYITMYIPQIQSCIITRDCDKTVNVRTEKLIQTNCDWNKTEPDILWSVERRNKVSQIQDLLLKEKNLTETQILDYLMIYPIINDETIYVHYQCGDKYETIIL